MTKWPIQKQTLSTVQNTQKNKTMQQKFSIFFISYYLFIKITKTINDLINIKLQMAVFCIQMMHLSIFCPPGGGGGHTRGFRQKTIPDRREFDKLMESGSRVI